MIFFQLTELGSVYKYSLFICGLYICWHGLTQVLWIAFIQSGVHWALPREGSCEPKRRLFEARRCSVCPPTAFLHFIITQKCEKMPLSHSQGKHVTAFLRHCKDWGQHYKAWEPKPTLGFPCVLPFWASESPSESLQRSSGEDQCIARLCYARLA